jgi:hypothetical protein
VRAARTLDRAAFFRGRADQRRTARRRPALSATLMKSTVVMLAPVPAVAMSRNLKSPGTSGVNVGLRTVVDERSAVASTGRRITLQRNSLAVDGELSSCRRVPTVPLERSIVATSGRAGPPIRIELLSISVT